MDVLSCFLIISQPDFGLELYDLHQFSDDEIKGNIISRVALLLLRHIRDLGLRQKLPGILALLKTLKEKETGRLILRLRIFLRNAMWKLLKDGKSITREECWGAITANMKFFTQKIFTPDCGVLTGFHGIYAYQR